VISDGGPTRLAVVNLTNLLNSSLVPRTSGGHACFGDGDVTGFINPDIVRFITLPSAAKK